MTVYLATNKAVDLGGYCYDVTTVDTFDAAYVSSSIEFKTDTGTSAPLFWGHVQDVSADTEAWLHYDVDFMASNSSTADGSYFTLLDPADRVAAVCTVLNGTFTLTVYDRAGATTASAGFIMPIGNATFDILYKDDSTNVTVTLYIGGSSVASATRAVGAGTSRVPNRIQWDNNDFTIANGTMHMSQLIWANESTVGMKLEVLDANAAGNYTDLSATVSEVADGDMATGWVGSTSTQKQSYTLPTYTVPAARAVHSVVPTFDIRTGGTGPQNIRPFLRISAVDYAAPADLGPDPITKRSLLGYAWTVNPATSLPWTASEIAALDVGVEIKT